MSRSEKFSREGVNGGEPAAVSGVPRGRGLGPRSLQRRNQGRGRATSWSPSVSHAGGAQRVGASGNKVGGGQNDSKNQEVSALYSKPFFKFCLPLHWYPTLASFW